MSANANSSHTQFKFASSLICQSVARYSIFLLAFAFLSHAHSNTLELTTARRFVKGYEKNEARLHAIDHELESLPQPYPREPTGTGGFLSGKKKDSNAGVLLTFTWKDAAKLDAIALFPLRLFIEEIYGENLFWPGSITIEAEINGVREVLGERKGSQTTIQQSLPELIRFDPISTSNLTIRCADLQQHPHKKWYAAGFAEICIFSESRNLAPQATLKHNGSRQGFHVLAAEFLTDAHTPLGLPELKDHSENKEFLKKLGFKEKILTPPYVLTLTYPQATLIDAVRIDPAIQHSYGQGFPERFTIALLDESGKILQRDTTYETFAMRNPGLNPHLAYFPETLATAVQLTVLEASQPIPNTLLTISFSEITPMHHGLALPPPDLIEEQFLNKKTRIEQNTPLETPTQRSLASACDGQTQSGRVLSQREWVMGLVRRQQLLEEQLLLGNSQHHALVIVRKTLIWGTLTLLFLVIGSALFLVVRSHAQARKEIRRTRLKIASDLHDDIGSNLGTIVLHAEKLQETNVDPGEQKRLNAILRLTKESVFGLREVLHTTAPEVGRSQNIIAYMHELAGLILGITSFAFEADPSLNEKIPDDAPLRKGLLLFYKEALYNAKSHAQCSQVDISLRWLNHALILNIKDNGIGIDEQTLRQERTLRTLKQRAQWLPAKLQICSEPGKGTGLTLTCKLPCNKRNRHG